jgi:ATP-dependent helicase HrpB
MLLAAGERNMGVVAAEVAVLLSERGIGGDDPDLEVRRRRWRGERGGKAMAARHLAQRWARLAGGGDAGEGGEGACVALAFPDRIARRRDAGGEHWASVGGRGFRLDPASSLARSEWLAVAETQGVAAGARILSAAPIDMATIEALFGDRIESVRTLSFDPATGGVEARRERRLGALRLRSGTDAEADPAAIAAALVEGVRAHGLSLLPWDDCGAALRTRAGYAGIDADALMLAAIDQWLPTLVAGKRRLSQIAPGDLADAMRDVIGWDAMRRIDRAAPSHFTSPAGSSHAIDYGAEGGPRVELRVQALFGLAEHPLVGGVPLVLSLTSPAGRPIQTTRDLPGFWAGSWAAVAKEMRGRYPRHPWPDDPAAAAATLRTKNADVRARGSR